MILYNKEETESDILSAVHTVRNENSSDEDYLKALETLTKHLKEVII